MFRKIIPPFFLQHPWSDITVGLIVGLFFILVAGSPLWLIICVTAEAIMLVNLLPYILSRKWETRVKSGSVAGLILISGIIFIVVAGTFSDVTISAVVGSQVPASDLILEDANGTSHTSQIVEGRYEFLSVPRGLFYLKYKDQIVFSNTVPNLWSGWIGFQYYAGNIAFLEAPPSATPTPVPTEARVTETASSNSKTSDITTTPPYIPLDKFFRRAADTNARMPLEPEKSEGSVVFEPSVTEPGCNGLFIHYEFGGEDQSAALVIDWDWQKVTPEPMTYDASKTGWLVMAVSQWSKDERFLVEARDRRDKPEVLDYYRDEVDSLFYFNLATDDSAGFLRGSLKSLRILMRSNSIYNTGLYKRGEPFSGSLCIADIHFTSDSPPVASPTPLPTLTFTPTVPTATNTAIPPTTTVLPPQVTPTGP